MFRLKEKRTTGFTQNLQAYSVVAAAILGTSVSPGELPIAGHDSALDFSEADDRISIDLNNNGLFAELEEIRNRIYYCIESHIATLLPGENETNSSSEASDNYLALNTSRQPSWNIFQGTQFPIPQPVTSVCYTDASSVPWFWGSWNFGNEQLFTLECIGSNVEGGGWNRIAAS